MNMLVGCLAAALSLGAVTAPAPPLEVDQAEVLRLGNTLQHVDGGVQAGAEDALAALGPPTGDADKWFISVVTTQGCAPCERLKAAWRSDPWLLALANPEDGPASWAHYNEYAYEDASQAFRWESVRITAFPTVIVQPPRTGKYGDPRTVVFQDVYRGDAKQLAESITRAVRRYVARVDVPPAENAGPRAALGSVAPPWQPTPVEKPAVKPTLDLPPLKIPPDDGTTPFSWQQLLWQILGALVTAVLGYFAGRRQSPVVGHLAQRRPRKRSPRRAPTPPEPAQP